LISDLGSSLENGNAGILADASLTADADFTAGAGLTADAGFGGNVLNASYVAEPVYSDNAVGSQFTELGSPIVTSDSSDLFGTA
jgi:hypothetical protein